jgi:hypothetical protein
MKWILSLLLLGAFAFCVYGFLATFEPMDHPTPWRICYVVGGILAVLVIARVWRSSQ